MQIGFAGLLTILFVGLKLTDVIAWSWVWVLAPMWIGVALWLTVVISMVSYFGYKDWKFKNRNRRK